MATTKVGVHVIVCWEKNWPNCPLEVIELNAEIWSLDSIS